jgi:predicted RNase H-like nuclease (RuvC/YqgF family)
VEQSDELTQLRNRVRVLEERIQGLRASRRILMNLITAQEREKRARIQRLEQENTRLQQQSTRYAKAVLERNIRIIRLEQALQRPGSQEDIS